MKHGVNFGFELFASLAPPVGVEKPPGGGGAAGVTTPAAGLGSSIVERLVAETGAKFELKEGVQVKSSL